MLLCTDHFRPASARLLRQTCRCRAAPLAGSLPSREAKLRVQANRRPAVPLSTPAPAWVFVLGMAPLRAEHPASLLQPEVPQRGEKVGRMCRGQAACVAGRALCCTEFKLCRKAPPQQQWALWALWAGCPCSPHSTGAPPGAPGMCWLLVPPGRGETLDAVPAIAWSSLCI